MSEQKITAAIPTYNRHKFLSQTVDSLIGQSMPGDQYEILIVDNSPDPHPGKEFVRKYASVSNLRYVYQESPGLSRARNRALEECRSEFVAFIDDDAVADTRFLEEICGVFDSPTGRQVGVVGGPVIPVWETAQPAWLHPDLFGFLTIVDWSQDVVELDEHQWLAGTNIAYRMSVVRKIDGFREDLGRIGAVRMANDELEFTGRIRKLGWKVVYSPRIRVSHRIPAKRTDRAWIRRRNMWQGLSEAVLKGEQFDDRQNWDELRRACASLGTDLEGLQSIFDATEDPERYRQQCAAIRSLVHIVFRGGR